MSFLRHPEYKRVNASWVREIPVKWEVARLGFEAETVVPMRDKPERLDGEVPWIRIEDFQGKYISTSKSGQGVSEDTISSMNLKVFPAGTVLCSCSCNMGATAIAAAPLVSNQTFIGIVPGRSYKPEYLYYLLQASSEHLNSIGTGAIQSYLSRDDFRRLRLPKPPLREQELVCSFLDRETAKIDALISEQQRLIDLLQEKRQAVISNAVTKGLNPNATTKDSGVEWLGEVPEHWDVVQIKWLSPVKRGASPRPIQDPKYFDDSGEYAWVRISDVTSSNGRLEATSQRLSELGSSLSVKLKPGSLFVSIAGSVGKTCITRIKACIHDGFVYFPDLRVSPEFLELIFISGKCFGGLGKLGTQLNLNTDTIGAIRVGVPRDNKEVDAIVKYCMQESERLGELEAAALGAVSLLSERRSALISAAVTGQIDVRGLATEEQVA